MGKSRTKTTTPALAVPQTDDEANAVLDAYGAGAVLLDIKDAEFQRSVRELKEACETQIKPLIDEQNSRLAALSAYAAANRKRLTDDGKKKSVELPAGKLGWRLKPPSVKLTAAIETVIATLQDLGMRRFIRLSPELNKERLLEEREKLAATNIPGITFLTGKELFYVEPVALELSQARSKAAAT